MTEDKVRTRHPVPWKNTLHEVIYESETWMGKVFDILLMVSILVSILVVMLDSVQSIHDAYGGWLLVFEWIFTIFFTIEYILRLIVVTKPSRYALSFLGIIDLLAIIPTYLSLFYAGTQYLIVIRALRLLRVFRIFKMWHFMGEGQVLLSAIVGSYRKISIFMLFVTILVIILGSLMYLVEGGQNGFDSIPNSIYWAVVTLTTVGYGDISPVSPLGKFCATIIMLCGYGIIAVPTGIITTEITLAGKRQHQTSNEACPGCGKTGHAPNANYCDSCGDKLMGSQ
jgi:voltage-gated potassium channel